MRFSLSRLLEGFCTFYAAADGWFTNKTNHDIKAKEQKDLCKYKEYVDGI